MVWILNRGYKPAEDVRVVIQSKTRYRKGKVYRLCGTGPDDASPTWGEVEVGKVSGNVVDGLPCPGVSVTVVLLEAI